MTQIGCNLAQIWHSELAIPLRCSKDGIPANIPAGNFLEVSAVLHALSDAYASNDTREKVAYIFKDVPGEGYRAKPLVSEGSKDVATRVSTAWINLITDSNPNGDDSPEA